MNVMLFCCHVLLQGDSPLYVASMEGHDQVVEVLTRTGADVNFIHKEVCY